MEILIGLASMAIGLALTTLSIKLAAGWLDAEHTGWGRALGALLLTYVALIGLVFVISVMGGAVTAAGAGLAVTGLALLGLILLPIIIFAYVLGTNLVRAAGIVIISLLVNVFITFAISFGLAMILGAGMAGMAGLIGLSGLFGGMLGQDSNEAALDQFSAPLAVVSDSSAIDQVAVRVDELCECTDEACVDTVFTTLWEELTLATESAPIIDGDEQATARLDTLLARIDECQEPGGGAALIASADNDDAELESSTEESHPQAEADISMTADQAVTGMPTSATPARSTPVLAAREPGKPRALSRYYVLRVIEPDDASAHLNKLIRLTLNDGRRFSDQLVAVENGSLVLQRDRAQGNKRYAVKLKDISRLEVFGL